MADNGAKLPQEWTDEEIYQEVGKIVSLFNLFECDECAKAVIQWLQENGLSGKIIRVKTRYSEDFIMSTRCERVGLTDSITINGKHYGIEVRGRVFDNLSAEGMLKEDWLDDLQCAGGEFVVDELDNL